ncbi:MAG: glycosyltransferase family 39 protein [Patescibacteria group bacterium]|nr:glycosyltransferase family 39 protein [Patescibacteria group bacterium]
MMETKPTYLLLFLLVVIGAAFLVELALGIGLMMLFLLSAGTFVVLKRIGVVRKHLVILFMVVFLVHLAATLFIHYAEFYPFGGGEGDQGSYHAMAVVISENFRQGDFSLSGISETLGLPHYYPVVVGGLYAIAIPDLLVGQLFNVWLVALSVLLVYFISLEIGASPKWALFSGLLVGIYPSYLYFGSLLLREALVAVLSLFALLFILKLMKGFSFKYFLVFYVAAALLVHFRFYIGFVLILTFILVWPFVERLNLKKKVIYGALILVLLGFLPQFSGFGYYGSTIIPSFLNQEKITYMREIVYPYSEDATSGRGSTVVVRTGFENPPSFAKHYLISFLFVALGPLPWHIIHPRQLFVLLEVIPWYVFSFFIVRGIVKLRYTWKRILPLVLFSLGVFAVVSLFIDNFGIYTRLRIPAFIALLSVASLYLSSSQLFSFLEQKMNMIWNNGTKKYEDT